MKKIFLLLMVICNCINTNAQVPGYMGKKLSIGYDFNFYLGGVSSKPRMYDSHFIIHQPDFFLNKFHEFHLDYVLTKSYSLGFSYQFFKTGQRYTELGSNNYYTANYEASNYLNISGYTIQINNKFFFFNRGTGLAPIGNYGKLSIGLITAQTKAKINGEYRNETETEYFTRYITYHNITTPVISGGFGNQSILFERIILDIGLDFAFVPGALKGIDLFDNYSDNYYSVLPEVNLAENEIQLRLQTFYLSSVKVGIGILLF